MVEAHIACDVGEYTRVHRPTAFLADLPENGNRFLADGLYIALVHRYGADAVATDPTVVARFEGRALAAALVRGLVRGHYAHVCIRCARPGHSRYHCTAHHHLTTDRI